MNTECLKIRGLKVVFYSGDGFIKAVEGVDLDVHEGECVAIVGESGQVRKIRDRTVDDAAAVVPSGNMARG